MTPQALMEKPRRGPAAWKAALSRGARAPRALRALAAALGLAAAGAAWSFLSGRPKAAFPRRDFEFLPPQAVDAQLKGLGDRLKADPQDIGALAESGFLHYQRGKDYYPEAINELEEAWKLGALDDRIFYYLGVMYQEEGLYAFAVPAYRKFLRNRPQDREARLLLAKLLYQNGRYAEAAEQYKRLLERRDKDPLLEENLGLCQLSLKQDADAARTFTELAGMGVEASRRAHFYLGELAFDAGEYGKADEHFRVVLPLEGRPDLGLPPADVHSRVAANYEKLKLFEAAKEHWEKALLLDPKNAKAKASLKTINAALKAAGKPAKKKKR